MPRRKEAGGESADAGDRGDRDDLHGHGAVNYSASIVPYPQLSVSFKSAGYVTSILQRKGVDGRVRNLQRATW